MALRIALACVLYLPMALATLIWQRLTLGPEPVDCIYAQHPHHGACPRPYRERSAIEQYTAHLAAMEQGRRLQALEEHKADSCPLLEEFDRAIEAEVRARHA